MALGNRSAPPDRSARGWGRTDALCLGPLLALTVWSLVGGGLAISLIGTHPLLFEALRGSIPAMVSAGGFSRVGQVAVWQALLAPLLILCAADPFLYWAGWRYGPRLKGFLIENDVSWRERMPRLERSFARWGAWAVAFGSLTGASGAFVYFAAGDVRMRLWLFAVSDLAGTLLRVAAFVGLGYFLGGRAVAVAMQVSRYGLWATIGLLVLIVLGTVLRTRRNLAANARRQD
ncbi:MAG: hypothetical protein M3010_03705 [Candidatus Dormibacteraeota bacterium]|nr:hypothetical protein [Candidatus Dormibacteraeota bacterium]